MPYELEETPDGWYVRVIGTKRRMSKKPLSHERVTAQLRALYANDPHAKSEKGGAGSGNFGHAGRPGLVGGSREGGISYGISQEIDKKNSAKEMMKNGVLFHGTSAYAARSIEKGGHIVPRIGKIVRSAYGLDFGGDEENSSGEKILTPFVYINGPKFDEQENDAPLKRAIGYCRFSVAKILKKAIPDVTEDDMVKYGAIVSVNKEDMEYVHGLKRMDNQGEVQELKVKLNDDDYSYEGLEVEWNDRNWEHVGQETGDYFSEESIPVSTVVRGSELRKLLKAYGLGMSVEEFENYGGNSLFPLRDYTEEKEVSSTPTASYGHGAGGVFSVSGLGGSRDVLPRRKRKIPAKNKKISVNVVKLSHIRDLFSRKEEMLKRTTKTKDNNSSNKPSAEITVFKDAQGKYRWVLLSSNCFRDRDNEIVSYKSLLEDVERADKEGDYGPLRWWHEDGWDIGDCDFNMMHGKILVESGTFRNPVIAKRVKEWEDQLEASIAFKHPVSEPDENGVFHHIRRFERSLLPKGRASNLFTRLIVKGDGIMANKKEKKDILNELIGDESLVNQVISGAETVEKQAIEDGVDFKEKKEDLESLADQIIAGEDSKKSARGVVLHKPVEKAPEKTGEKIEEDASEEKVVPKKKVTVVRRPVVAKVEEEEADTEYVGDDDENLEEDSEEEADTNSDVMDGEEEEMELPDVIGNMTPDEFSEILTTALAEALAPYLRKLKEVSNTVDSVVAVTERVQERIEDIGTVSTKEKQVYEQKIEEMEITLEKLGKALTISAKQNGELESRLKELEADVPNSIKQFIASQDDSTTVKEGDPILASQPQIDPVADFATNFVFPKS